MKKLLIVAAIIVLVLVAVLAVRALTISSKQITAAPAPPLQIDRNAAAARLARAVQFRTVSSEAMSDRDAFVAWIAQAYPRVHASLQREVVGNGALLYTWTGSDATLKPLLLMGHYDTVPIEPVSLAKWQHAPFSGDVADGFVWGRGTLDDKLTVIALLEAAESLLAQNHRPRRTIHFAFGCDEEIGGEHGAHAVAKHLTGRGIQLDAVLDEGGIISTNKILGLTKPVAVIGIAEKGSATIELVARGEGGHSSMPPPRTEVGAIAAAVDRVQSHPFDTGVHGASAAMFRWLAPETPFGYRVITSNLWLLEPLIEQQAKRSRSFNAMLRTTTAPTVMNGGVKDNVIPSEARAMINFRILPGDSARSVVEHVKRVVDDDHISVRIHESWEPSPVSDPEAPQFRALQRTIAQTFPGVLVAPYLVVGATDGRWFRGLTPNVYRFMPVVLSEEDLERIHGINERVSIDGYIDAIRFYRLVITNMGGT